MVNDSDSASKSRVEDGEWVPVSPVQAEENRMMERNTLRRRIQTCRMIMCFQIAVVIASMVAVWNPPQMYRHLFNVLWYGSLFSHTGLALFLGRRFSHAKEELYKLNHSLDA